VVSLREQFSLDVGASPHAPGIFGGIARVSEGGCSRETDSGTMTISGETEPGSAGTQLGEG